MGELKSIVEQVQTALVVSVSAAAFIATLVVAGYFQFRKWSRKMHGELTNKENGGFRAEFTRFQDVMIGYQKNTLDRLRGIETFRGNLDGRLNGVETRLNHFESRFTGIDAQLSQIDNAETTIVEQQNMILGRLDEQAEELLGRCHRKDCPQCPAH